MITKAIIVETPLNNSNKFKIQIPTLVKANSNKDNFILDATLCYQPGVILGYNIGDVVFVAFEDNYIEKPIILGKLYKTDSLDNEVEELPENDDLPEEDADEEEEAFVYQEIYYETQKSFCVLSGSNNDNGAGECVICSGRYSTA